MATQEDNVVAAVLADMGRLAPAAAGPSLTRRDTPEPMEVEGKGNAASPRAGSGSSQLRNVEELADNDARARVVAPKWTTEENQAFFEGLTHCGRNFQKISKRVKTKNEQQTRDYFYRSLRKVSALLSEQNVSVESRDDADYALTLYWRLCKKHKLGAKNSPTRMRFTKLFAETYGKRPAPAAADGNSSSTPPQPRDMKKARIEKRQAQAADAACIERALKRLPPEKLARILIRMIGEKLPLVAAATLHTLNAVMSQTPQSATAPEPVVASGSGSSASAEAEQQTVPRAAKVSAPKPVAATESEPILEARVAVRDTTQPPQQIPSLQLSDSVVTREPSSTVSPAPKLDTPRAAVVTNDVLGRTSPPPPARLSQGNLNEMDILLTQPVHVPAVGSPGENYSAHDSADDAQEIVSLLLQPESPELGKAISDGGQKANLKLTFKMKKPIGEIVQHINKKWTQCLPLDHTGQPVQLVLTTPDTASGLRGPIWDTREASTVRMVYKQLGCPAMFRLLYAILPPQEAPLPLPAPAPVPTIAVETSTPAGNEHRTDHIISPFASPVRRQYNRMLDVEASCDGFGGAQFLQSRLGQMEFASPPKTTLFRDGMDELPWAENTNIGPAASSTDFGPSFMSALPAQPSGLTKDAVEADAGPVAAVATGQDQAQLQDDSVRNNVTFGGDGGAVNPAHGHNTSLVDLLPPPPPPTPTAGTATTHFDFNAMSPTMPLGTNMAHNKHITPLSAKPRVSPSAPARVTGKAPTRIVPVNVTQQQQHRPQLSQPQQSLGKAHTHATGLLLGLPQQRPVGNVFVSTLNERSLQDMPDLNQASSSADHNSAVNRTSVVAIQPHPVAPMILGGGLLFDTEEDSLLDSGVIPSLDKTEYGGMSEERLSDQLLGNMKRSNPTLYDGTGKRQRPRSYGDGAPLAAFQ